jgi:hypothetical protein
VEEDLIDLEQRGWQALLPEPAAARRFYDDRIVVLLADAAPIRALDALCGVVWADFRVHGLRCVPLSEGREDVDQAVAGLVRHPGDDLRDLLAPACGHLAASPRSGDGSLRRS